MNKFWSYLLAVSLPLVSVAQNEKGNPHRLISEIDKKIPELLEDFHIPGAALAFFQNGEIVLQKCYGFANVESKTPVTPQTGFNIGSISKVVTGWGVMKLVEDGKLDLDAPVSQYLTQWKIPESEFNTDGVTVRRLLSHTAGLSHSSVSRELGFDSLPTIVEWLNGDNDGLGPVKLILEPGTKWDYSGGGYGVVQLIIEEISGQKFEDFMQSEIIDPLGMKNSGFKIDKKIREGSATSYGMFGERTEFGLYTVQSAAGFHTTLEDFVRFAIASLPNHKKHSEINSVLEAKTVSQMQEPAPNTTIGGWKYGLGYQSVHTDDGRVFIGHAGSNTGWQANFRIDQKTQTGFIVFTNSSSGSSITDPMFCQLFKLTDAKPGENDCWPKPSISGKIMEFVSKNGLNEIESAYKELKTNHADVYDFSESQLNELGYHYLGNKEFDKANAIFKLNVKLFPYAYNTYDSYGEALLASGNKGMAIENYRYSIRLNPNNDNGIRVLESIGESLDGINLKVDEDHLKKFAGEYAADSSESDKVITYAVKDGELIRDYGNGSRKLIPLGDDEFVYLDRNIHVKFDTTDPENIILRVTGEGDFKKVK